MLLNEMIDKRANLVNNYRKANEAFTESKQAEDKTKMDNIFADIKELDEAIARESVLSSVVEAPKEVITEDVEQLTEEELFSKALREQSSLSVTIPTSIETQVINALNEKSIMRGLCTVKSIGHKRSIPIRPDVSAATWTAEGTTVSAEDVDYTSKLLTAKRLPKVLEFFRSELEDSSLNVNNEIVALMSDAIVKAQEASIFGASGSATVPYGLLDAITINQTTATIATVALADYKAMLDKIASKYDAGSCFFANDAQKSNIRLMTDASGNYIVGDNWDGKQFLGKNIYFNSYIPASTTPVLFGNPRYYVIGDRKGIQIENITGADDKKKSQESFLGTMWSDGALAVPASFAKMTVKTE